MIIEGLLTTVDANGALHLAPMGPRCDEPLHRLILRPFCTSQSFLNLQRSRQGVFHVTDDVLLLAEATIHRLSQPPRVAPANHVDGYILLDACRYYELRVTAIHQDGPRADIETQVVGWGRLRDFAGLCRAKHAVVEAAILASRVHLLQPDEIVSLLRILAPLVEKTGGPAEFKAFALLCQYMAQHYQAAWPDSRLPSWVQDQADG
ncbi:MAG: DUF447 domain-containing protein [Gemmataceae bacterium]